MVWFVKTSYTLYLSHDEIKSIIQARVNDAQAKLDEITAELNAEQIKYIRVA